jgi:hypothetical protein
MRAVLDTVVGNDSDSRENSDDDDNDEELNDRETA